VIQIDSFLPEQSGDILEGALAAVDLVEGRVVLEGRASNHELCVRDFAVTFRVLIVAVVDDLLKEDLDATRSGKQIKKYNSPLQKLNRSLLSEGNSKCNSKYFKILL
jgi:hypothetical protein